MKPLEVEILVAELGEQRDLSRLYHISYDGTVSDEGALHRFAFGGENEAIS